MVGLFANSGDPDQTPRSAASDLGLHCLPVTRLGVSSIQWVKYSIVLNALKLYRIRVRTESTKVSRFRQFSKPVILEEGCARKSEELRLAEIQRLSWLHGEVRPSYFWLLSCRQPHLLAACKSAVLFKRIVRSVSLACGNVIALYIDRHVLWYPVSISTKHEMWQTVWKRFDIDHRSLFEACQYG